MQHTQIRRSPVAYLFAIMLGAALIVGMASLPASPAQAAETQQTIGDYTYRFDPDNPDAGAVISYYSGRELGTVDIPKTVRLQGKTYNVVGIGDDSFMAAENSGVTIPETVTWIGRQAFFMSALTEVSIPASVTSVGDKAFMNTGISTVALTDGLQTIGAQAFQKIPLESIVIPETVTSIGAGAFQESPLASVTLPATLDELGNSAFAYTQLTSVTLPSGLTSIAPDLFSQTPLESIVIPEGITSIGEHAFFRSDFVGTQSGGVTGLTSVTLPTSLTHIGDSAFLGGQLTSVTLPAKLEIIEGGAFNGNRFTELTIPASVTSIGANAFVENKEGTALSSVYFEGNAPEVVAAGREHSFPEETATVYFNCTAQGFAAPTWQGYASASECGVTFDMQHDGKGSTVQASYGAPLERPADPQREGHTFAGWFTDPEGTTPYDFSLPVTGEFTVYAAWTADEKPPVTTPQPPTAPGGSDEPLANSGSSGPGVLAAGGALALLAGAVLLARRRLTH